MPLAGYRPRLPHAVIGPSGALGHRGFLIVPLGDLVDRRRLIVAQGLLASIGLVTAEPLPAVAGVLPHYQPHTLITWGANDEIFPEAGAHPYRRDLPLAEVVILKTGYFALEDHADVIAGHLSRFTASLPEYAG